jgi:hypothetical protein
VEQRVDAGSHRNRGSGSGSPPPAATAAPSATPPGTEPEDRRSTEEFLKFLRTIDREVPKALAVHMILDNYATHVCPESEVMTM